MTKTITSRPGGTIQLPPSKSIMHRAVICAVLAGQSVSLPPISDDIDVTAACMASLASNADSVILDCMESGSTLRFLIPVAAALKKPAVFTGRGRLLERPMDVYLDELRRHGAEIRRTSSGIEVSGTLNSGDYALPGNISSQFISGLLFALPLTGGRSTITLTTPTESAAYIDLTIDELARSGITVLRRDNTFIIPADQTYSPRDVSAEADFSQAAFFLVGGAISGQEIRCAGLNLTSRQGDRAIVDLLQASGAVVTHHSDDTISASGSTPSPLEIDVSDIPDLVPPLAALLSVANGKSRIYNAARLRMKESDRLETVAAGLNALGADIRIIGDTLEIHGVSTLHGGTVDACGDHRIAMMAAVASLRADGPVTVIGAECVKKSYPNFWRDWES